STIVFILPLHLDYTKVIILILWWRNFQLEYWRTFQLVSTAKELGLDKNTIGKAVRGGNMNINVLLSIANHWNFPITDFFIFVNQEECEETYFISPNKYNNNSANDNLLVSEDSKIYKNIKNLSTEELALKASKQQEISLLQNLIRNYQDRIDLLQQELGQYKSE
ncbi:hypothetical protein, partial [Barnesiella intestinihominis]|uniref:hypothetical protein n=3 Tax=Barnesiella intestinihominis TaxID=487174 RepID=UPI002F949ABE